MVSAGISCIKYLLLGFNFLFALSGIGLIVAGAFVLRDVHHYNSFLEATTLLPPIALLVSGSIVFLISFLGCCGAIKESFTMLITFAILLSILLILQITLAVFSAVHRETFEEGLRQSMKHSIDNYDPTSVNDRRMWAQLQSKLECCGVEDSNDWKLGGLYPASCCKTPQPMAEDLLCGPSKERVFQEGCYESLRLRVKDGSLIIIGVCGAIAMIEVGGIILSCVLATTIKKEREEADKE